MRQASLRGAMGAPLADETAFRRIAERHRRELHVHCARMVGSFDDGEDLVQETLMRAWRSRETSEHEERVRGWLYRIATNVCIDELQRRRRSLPEPQVTAAPGADELAEQREAIRQALRAAVERLSPRQRAVYVLRDVLDWPAADTAELLGMSVPAANSALQRARATLRPELAAAYAA